MPRRVQRFSSGQPVGGPRGIRGQLNQIVDIVNRRDRAAPLPVVGVCQIIEVEIKTLNADTLTCIDPGATEPTSREYTVELPPTFTEASRGGVSYVYSDLNHRTADGTENQELTPVYVVGDMLSIRLRDVGDGDWRDTNDDGRQWAKVP